MKAIKTIKKKYAAKDLTPYVWLFYRMVKTNYSQHELKKGSIVATVGHMFELDEDQVVEHLLLFSEKESKWAADKAAKEETQAARSAAEEKEE